MTNKEKWRAYAEAETLTDAQKAAIKQAAEKAGFVFKPYNSKCGGCYKDMAVLLWKKEFEKEAAKDKSRKYILKPDTNVIWRGKLGELRVDASCTDEQLAKYLANGFPREFFSKIDESNE